MRRNNVFFCVFADRTGSLSLEGRRPREKENFPVEVHTLPGSRTWGVGPWIRHQTPRCQLGDQLAPIRPVCDCLIGELDPDEAPCQDVLNGSRYPEGKAPQIENPPRRGGECLENTVQESGFCIVSNSNSTITPVREWLSLRNRMTAGQASFSALFIQGSSSWVGAARGRGGAARSLFCGIATRWAAGGCRAIIGAPGFTAASAAIAAFTTSVTL